MSRLRLIFAVALVPMMVTACSSSTTGDTSKHATSTASAPTSTQPLKVYTQDELQPLLLAGGEALPGFTIASGGDTNPTSDGFCGVAGRGLYTAAPPAVTSVTFDGADLGDNLGETLSAYSSEAAAASAFQETKSKLDSCPANGTLGTGIQIPYTLSKISVSLPGVDENAAYTLKLGSGIDQGGVELIAARKGTLMLGLIAVSLNGAGGTILSQDVVDTFAQAAVKKLS